MPERLATLLATENGANKLCGSLPFMAQRLEREHRIKAAYLCDDSAMQVWKLRGEGNHFCCYRNIQMFVPDMQDKNVLELQDMIERAWDANLNSRGRIETGGIKGTRKHIGTLEVGLHSSHHLTCPPNFLKVQALLNARQILHRSSSFHGRRAYKELLDSVEAYFRSTCDQSSHSLTGRIMRTAGRPVYLQMPYHSVTVVGCYRTASGRSLLVFDPSLMAPSALRVFNDRDKRPRSCFRGLWRYRRNELYLRRHKQFETLQIIATKDP